MTDERSAYDEKLESILRTAAAIFAEKGYHQASIRDIARATGVSLSGLYYYFDSKEELLFLIQDHAFGTLLGNLERMLEGVEEPHRRLRILMENHLRYFIGAKAEMKVLSHESESLTGDFRRTVNAKKRRLTDIAHLLGYSNLASFSAWYRARFNETPTVARSRAKVGALRDSAPSA